MTRALVVMATLAIGIALGGALSQVSPVVQTVLAATGLVERGTPQVGQESAWPPPAKEAPKSPGNGKQGNRSPGVGS
jgi:hypothetical protein